MIEPQRESEAMKSDRKNFLLDRLEHIVSCTCGLNTGDVAADHELMKLNAQLSRTIDAIEKVKLCPYEKHAAGCDCEGMGGDR